MRYLDRESVDELEALVNKGGENTEGRLVTVVADQSGQYGVFHLLFAFSLFFVAPICAAALFNYIPHPNAFLGQVVFLVGLFLFLSWSKIGVQLIPPYIRKRFCKEKANSYFLDKELHRNKSGAGVLIYVSAAEDYIEVIADRDVASEVSNDIWSEIREHAKSKIKKNGVKSAIAFTVEACQSVLSELYPTNGDSDQKNRSELVTVASK